MARKKKTDLIPITIYVSAFDVNEYDRLAPKAGLNRSQLMRNVMHCALEELRILEKSGALQGAVYFRDLGQKIGKFFQPVIPMEDKEKV